MKRRTVDMAFSVGGIVLAGVALVLGMVLTSNASFARSYVSDQLRQQKITFKTAATLTDEEKKSACVVANAGKQLTTGKQAECYANEFIALHLRTMAATKGMTYAEIGVPQSELRAQIAAKPANDPALPGLQKQLADITAARETLFKGETLRGLLLTSYGFSVFGEKAAQAARVLNFGAFFLALLSIAGLAHAVWTPAGQRVRLPGTDEPKEWNGYGPVAQTAKPKARAQH